MTLRYKVVKSDRTSCIAKTSGRIYSADSLHEDEKYLGFFIFKDKESANEWRDYDEQIIKVETLAREDLVITGVLATSDDISNYLRGRLDISKSNLLRIKPPSGTLVCRKIKVLT